MRIFLLGTITILLSASGACLAQRSDDAKNAALQALNDQYATLSSTALQIWDYAELGYKETKSSQALQALLQANGFTVEAGVAGMPTAFTATYGSGKPVIAVLAEYDALPGLSQAAVPARQPLEERNAGHGCGHHLFGVASAATGIAISQLMEKGVLKGTIKVFGCPAEEGGGGKIYMVRAGLFKEVDAVLHWHPGSSNNVTMTSALANKSAKFRFHGLSAHASASPEKGRSALDGVEAMNHMVNMMREHVPQDARIHYVITAGGKAPNVVPDFAEVYYYVRHPRREEAVRIFDRIVKAGEGAAMGTGNRMEYEVIGGTHDLLINRTLAEAMQLNLERVGGVIYNEEEKAFAQKIQSSFSTPAPPPEAAAQVSPLKETIDAGGGSTDVGDVSYVVPTVGLDAATWAPGTPMHSWQAVACGGTSMGTKGMMVAAKTMTLTAIDLFTQPALLAKARAAFEKQKGTYEYKALVGDRPPPLQYRD